VSTLPPFSPGFSAAKDPLDRGVTVVEASAGTGKTFAITRLVLRLLLDGRVSDITQIAVMTYTIAAAGELSGRIRTALAEAVERVTSGGGDDLADMIAAADPTARQRLCAALVRTDELAVNTIHGFCLQALELGAFAAQLSLTAEFLAEDDTLLDLAVADTWRATVYPDAHLAAVLVAMKRTPAQLRKEVNALRQHRDALILPAADSLIAAMTRLREAHAAAVTAWDDHAATGLRGGTWLKGKAIDKLGADSLVTDVAELATWSPAAIAAATLCGQDILTANHFKKPPAPTHAFFSRCTAFIAACTGVIRTVRVTQISGALHRFTTAKQAADVLGFDDLLHRLRDALADPAHGEALAAQIRQRWPVVLVDEFQDTDPVQVAILRGIWQRPGQDTAGMWLIGDPKQAIYAFRGADLQAYVTAVHSADHHRTLGVNYRATTAMVAAVNAIFSGENPFLTAEVPFHAVRAAENADDILCQAQDHPDASLVWWLGEDSGCIERQCVSTIAGLLASARLGDRALCASDCAILARTNRQGELLRSALTAIGIPAVTAGGGDVFSSREADDLALILAAVLDPGLAQRIRAACATRLLGFDAAAIAALADDGADMKTAHGDTWLAQAQRFAAWQQILRDAGIHALINHLLDSEDGAAHLLAYPDGERQVTNYRHLGELLHEAAQESHLAPRSLLGWLERERAEAGQVPRDRRELRLESDEEAVQILTVHRAKGLEFPVVFCPWLAKPPRARDPIMAHLADQRMALSWEADDDLKRRSDAENLAEDIRLVYVALTRASKRCYIGVSRDREVGSSGLAHLVGAADGDADQVHAAVIARAQAHPSHAWVQVDPTIAAPARQARSTADPLPTARVLYLPGHRLAPVQTASFTSLVRLAHGDELPIRDHADPGVVLRSSPGPLDALPAGARFGTVLHELLEAVNWQQPIIAAKVATALERAALDAAAAPALAAALETLRQTPWPDCGVRLDTLSAPQVWREWAFHLPSDGVDGQQLATLCAASDSTHFHTYAPRLRQLAPQAAAGFLTGSIDLLFEHAGRWWLADWKSNRLDDYGTASLTAAMHDHHYPLQALLYLVAVHRHLRARLPGYDPEQHLGGCAYIFIRGLDGQGGGFWTAPAPVALILAVDAACIAQAVAVQRGSNA